jgi:hypothetical protein
MLKLENKYVILVRLFSRSVIADEKEQDILTVVKSGISGI